MASLLLMKSRIEPFTTEDLKRMLPDFLHEMDMDEIYGFEPEPGSAELFIRWLEIKRDRGLKHKVEMYELF